MSDRRSEMARGDGRATAAVPPVRKDDGAAVRPTAEEIGASSFPASDPPQAWTWEVPRRD